MSRLGKFVLATYILLILYFLSTTYTAYSWGVDVPQTILTYALITVMSGVLISSRSAFITTGIIAFTVIFIGYLQQEHMIAVHSEWRGETANVRDTVIMVITLCVIALISWLSNREIEKSLNRARASETALRKQRDMLELMVEKRTSELQQVQAEKLTQLYRFAEFGRMASGLFHDLANPLGLVSLNLDRLNEKSKHLKQQELQTLLRRAISGAKQLENFVVTARKQMQNHEVVQIIKPKDEIEQVLQLLSHKAKNAQVEIVFHASENIKTFGNPMRFSQCVTNLLANAIDAYDDTVKKQKTINITLQQQNKNILLSVQDWGSGIAPNTLTHIFDPLFTTKSFQKGTGMGLAICRDIIEKDFAGKIKVMSKLNEGTTFTLMLPVRNAPSGKVKIQQN